MEWLAALPRTTHLQLAMPRRQLPTRRHCVYKGYRGHPRHQSSHSSFFAGPLLPPFPIADVPILLDGFFCSSASDEKSSQKPFLDSSMGTCLYSLWFGPSTNLLKLSCAVLAPCWADLATVPP